MTKLLCLRCGGQRMYGGIAELCAKCWQRLPRELRDDFLKAVNSHNRKERDRLWPFVHGEYGT